MPTTITPSRRNTHNKTSHSVQIGGYFIGRYVNGIKSTTHCVTAAILSESKLTNPSWGVLYIILFEKHVSISHKFLVHMSSGLCLIIIIILAGMAVI